MDSLISAAASALAAGDALGALNYVALRDDPSALALRGIAMAQLDDLPRARALLLVRRSSSPTVANGASHISRASKVRLSKSTRSTVSHGESALMRDIR